MNDSLTFVEKMDLLTAINMLQFKAERYEELTEAETKQLEKALAVIGILDEPQQTYSTT